MTDSQSEHFASKFGGMLFNRSCGFLNLRNLNEDCEILLLNLRTVLGSGRAASEIGNLALEFGISEVQFENDSLQGRMETLLGP